MGFLKHSNDKIIFRNINFENLNSEWRLKIILSQDILVSNTAISLSLLSSDSSTIYVVYNYDLSSKISLFLFQESNGAIIKNYLSDGPWVSCFDLVEYDKTIFFTLQWTYATIVMYDIFNDSFTYFKSTSDTVKLYAILIEPVYNR